MTLLSLLSIPYSTPFLNHCAIQTFSVQYLYHCHSPLSSCPMCGISHLSKFWKLSRWLDDLKTIQSIKLTFFECLATANGLLETVLVMVFVTYRNTDHHPPLSFVFHYYHLSSATPYHCGRLLSTITRQRKIGVTAEALGELRFTTNHFHNSSGLRTEPGLVPHGCFFSHHILHMYSLCPICSFIILCNHICSFWNHLYVYKP